MSDEDRLETEAEIVEKVREKDRRIFKILMCIASVILFVAFIMALYYAVS